MFKPHQNRVLENNKPIKLLMTKCQVCFTVLTSICFKYPKTPKGLNYTITGFTKLSGPFSSSRTDSNYLAATDPVLKLT